MSGGHTVRQRIESAINRRSTRSRKFSMSGSGGSGGGGGGGINKRQDKWRNLERHHCEICNSWMGGDRQSIMIHENGKKHRENVELRLVERRRDKLREDRAKDDLKKSLAEMERVAAVAHAGDLAAFGGASAVVQHQQQQQPPPHLSVPVVPQQQPPASTAGQGQPVVPTHHTAPPGSTASDVPAAKEKGVGDGGGGTSGTSRRKEMKSWQARKQKRAEEHRSKRGDDGDDDSSTPTTTTAATSGGKRLGEDEGHYVENDATYLEGSAYAPILEEEMPAQFWTGPPSSSSEEEEEERRRDAANSKMWKTGLVVRSKKKNGKDGTTFAVDFAYLANPDDEEETLAQGIDPSLLRLRLGSGGGVPETLEEARLALLGGEEVVVVDAAEEIDENTGFTKFSTVAVRRTTTHHEESKKRARAKARRREEAEREEKLRKEIEGRKMEEARHANADDSALGAYDIWTAGKGGYKGVDIGKETKLDVADTARRLAPAGKGGVEFRKRGAAADGGGGKGGKTPAFKKSKKKQFRRTTTADDDDDDLF